MTTVNTNVLMKYIVVPNRKVICLSHQKLLDPGIGSLKFLLAEEILREKKGELLFLL